MLHEQNTSVLHRGSRRLQLIISIIISLISDSMMEQKYIELHYI